jgi:hypothetical protein
MPEAPHYYTPYTPQMHELLKYQALPAVSVSIVMPAILTSYISAATAIITIFCSVFAAAKQLQI